MSKTVPSGPRELPSRFRVDMGQLGCSNTLLSSLAPPDPMWFQDRSRWVMWHGESRRGAR